MNLVSSSLAIVIEPHPCLASTIAEALRHRGFDVLIASTHAGAAALVIGREHVAFLVAAVPAPGEDRSGAYLDAVRRKNPDLAMIVVLSDPAEPADEAPAAAVRLVKPFDRGELERAVDQAMGRA